MFCPHCGCNNPDVAKFCAKCGKPIGDAPAGEAPGAEEAPQVVEAPRPVEAPQADVRKVPTPLVAGIVAAVAVVVAVSGYFIYTQASAPAQQGVAAEQAPDGSASDAGDQAQAEASKSEEEKAAEEKAAAEAKAAEEQKAAEEKAAAEQAAKEAQEEQEHQQKIADAEAQGLTVLTGTIRLFDTGSEVANYYGGDDMKAYTAIHRDLKFYSESGPYIVLDFDTEQTVSAMTADGLGPNAVSKTRASLDCGKMDRVYDLWKEYDGAHVTVACSDLWTQTDVSLPMGAVRVGNANVLFTL